MLKKKNDMVQENKQVSIVDGKLILSFPEADTPVVWQMDLAKATAYALEVQEDKKRKLFTLNFKEDNDNKSEIAAFSEKAQAVEALSACANALQNAQGKISQPANVTIANPQPKESNTAGYIMAFILILILLGIWSISARAPLDGAVDQTATATSSTSPNESGVAVSADSFLNNNR